MNRALIESIRLLDIIFTFSSVHVKATMTLENLDDDAVVISGMSGRFPKSGNINELMENLMNGIDCVSADHNRWSIGKDK